ncbi:MAG TPA: hypothetical protein VIM08_13570 [Arthrobacter sp.]
MAALTETSDPLKSPSPRGPVFVDASGRRLRRVKVIGLGALGLVAGYVVLLLVSFIGGSNIAAPYLPLPVPAAAPARDLPSGPAPEGGVHPTSEEQAAGPAPAAFGATVTGPSAAPAAPPATAAGVQPAAPAAASTPTTEPTNPGKSATAPGQTTRPSTPTHP